MSDRGPPAGDDAPEAADPQDASRRTYLASERTYLAWWRSGLAAIAIAVAIGALLPQLSDGGSKAGLIAIGAGFGLLGVATALYGALRERSISLALARGEYAPFPVRAVVALTVSAVILGIGAVVLVVARA